MWFECEADDARVGVPSEAYAEVSEVSE